MRVGAGVVEASLHSEVASVRSIIEPMGSKLSDVNPYLRDPAKRERAVLKSVQSSSAIEGIRVSLQKPVNGAGKPASQKARVKS